MCQFCQQNYWNNKKAKAKSKSWHYKSKFEKIMHNKLQYLCLNGIQQYGMIKGRVAPPKCLLHVATQIEKD